MINGGKQQRVKSCLFDLTLYHVASTDQPNNILAAAFYPTVYRIARRNPYDESFRLDRPRRCGVRYLLPLWYAAAWRRNSLNLLLSQVATSRELGKR